MLLRLLSRDRGSVLVLVPTAFLVLILLGAMSADGAVAYLGQRQLADTLASAASDAAGAGVDPASYYRAGRVVLDPAATATAACASLAAQSDTMLHRVRVEIAVDGTAVELVGTATVDAVFGRAIPGWGTRTVSASAVAHAEQAPGVAANPAAALVPLSCAG